VFAVAEDRMSCAPMPATQLATLGIFETSHLERWVVDHPEVLGDNIRIVTTQYGKWSSDSGDLAKERLDILGLDSSGQLVVVEAAHPPRVSTAPARPAPEPQRATDRTTYAPARGYVRPSSR
jgi:hypothetical protein